MFVSTAVVVFQLRDLALSKQLEGIYFHHGATTDENELRLSLQFPLDGNSTLRCPQKKYTKYNDEGPYVGDDEEHADNAAPLKALRRTFVNKGALQGSQNVGSDAMRGGGDDDGWERNNASGRADSVDYPQTGYVPGSPRHPTAKVKTVFRVTNSLALTSTGVGAHDSRECSPELYGRVDQSGVSRSGVHLSPSADRHRSSHSSDRDNSHDRRGRRRNSSTDWTPHTSRDDEARFASLDRERQRERARRTSSPSRENARRTEDRHRRDDRPPSPDRGRRTSGGRGHDRRASRERGKRRQDNSREGDRHKDPKWRSSRERATRLPIHEETRGRDLSGRRRGHRSSYSRSPSRSHTDLPSRTRGSSRGGSIERNRGNPRNSRYQDDRAGNGPSRNGPSRNGGNGRWHSSEGRRDRDPSSPVRIKREHWDAPRNLSPPVRSQRSERVARDPVNDRDRRLDGRMETTDSVGSRARHGTGAEPKPGPRAVSGAPKPVSSDVSYLGYASMADRNNAKAKSGNATEGYAAMAGARDKVAGIIGVAHGDRTDGRWEKPNAGVSRVTHGTPTQRDYGSGRGDSRGRERPDASRIAPRDGGVGDPLSRGGGADGPARSNNFRNSPQIQPSRDPPRGPDGESLAARPDSKRVLINAETGGDNDRRGPWSGKPDGNRLDDPANPRDPRWQRVGPGYPDSSPAGQRQATTGVGVVAEGGAAGNVNPEKRSQDRADGRFGGGPGRWPENGGGAPPRPAAAAAAAAASDGAPLGHPGRKSAPMPALPPAGSGGGGGARLMIKGTHPAVPERHIHALVSQFGVVGKIEVLEVICVVGSEYVLLVSALWMLDRSTLCGKARDGAISGGGRGPFRYLRLLCAKQHS